MIISACNFRIRLSYNPGMQIRTRSRKRNRIFGALLLAVSLLLAVYALWPTVFRTETFSLQSALLPQGYEIEVRYPSFGPSGEKAPVKAALRPVGQAADFASPGESNPVIVAEVQSATLTFIPAGQISTLLGEGKEVHFSWEARSAAAGEGQFNLFLFRAGAEEVEGVYLQQPVWARSFPYRTFSGAGGWKLPLLFFAVFGGMFGLGFVVINTLR
jgi:hypothetical protein